MKIRKFDIQIFSFIIGLFLFLNSGKMEIFASTGESMEEEYSPHYCKQLEAAYGKGMMSEGGAEAIEHMFDSVDLYKKSALDIGSGMGGVAFYLAENYGMQVTGLEVNPWMVTESKNRTPLHLQGQVDFFLSSGNSNWPISQESYDIVFSKGVLAHVEHKDEIFQECFRILKKDGLLVITDWLSSEKKAWGKNMDRLVELEKLSLFAESESSYVQVLKRNGFTLVSVRDDSDVYLQFNKDIMKRLQDPQQKANFLDVFSQEELQAAVEGYSAIVNAIESDELRVLHFIARKN